MSVKTQRQDARRRAREARSAPERARKAREKRLEDLAVTVLTSVDAIADHERLAGEALRVMVEEEGLSLREAASWCGDEVSVRTAARFRRLSESSSGDEAGDAVEDEVGDQAGSAGSESAQSAETGHAVGERLGSLAAAVLE